jgi:N-methylhydantoinase B
LESDSPLIVERRELIVDSGGPGKQRGALGRREVFRVPDDGYAPQPPVNLGIQSGRFRIPPDGLFGGGPGAGAQFLVNGKPGNPYGLTRLHAGDVVIMDAAGGGGYGDSKGRDREALLRDVRDGKVSRESASRDYGVEITEEMLSPR